MNILEIFQSIEGNWPLLVFVFAASGIWWQGKDWFKKIEQSLDREGEEHRSQNLMLRSIHEKVENLENRISKIENAVIQIHEEQHDQEIKLAVLENTTKTTEKRRTSKI